MAFHPRSRVPTPMQTPHLEDREVVRMPMPLPIPTQAACLVDEAPERLITEVQTKTSRKKKKTNAQKCREYRERQKLQNTMEQNITAERSDECSETDQLLQAKKPKTNAERRRKHYEAQKLKKQASKKIPKTVKQKNKEYYDRKKKLKALNTLNHHSDAIPKDPNVKEKWMEVTGRANWFPNKCSTVCSKHFGAKDFVIKKSGNRYLKTGAVPNEDVVHIYKSSLESQTVDESNEDTLSVVCPKCKAKVESVVKPQEDEMLYIVAKVYHYLDQEYEDLKKAYADLSFPPLANILRRAALATGVTEERVVEILEKEKNAHVMCHPPKRRRVQSQSDNMLPCDEGSSMNNEVDDEPSLNDTSDENNSDEDIERQMECTLDEPRVYVDTKYLKTEPNPLIDCDTETVVIKEERQETTYNIEFDSGSTAQLQMAIEPKVEDCNLNNPLADNDSYDETVPRNEEKSNLGPVDKTLTNLNTTPADDSSDDDDEIVSRTKEKTKPGPVQTI